MQASSQKKKKKKNIAMSTGLCKISIILKTSMMRSPKDKLNF